VQVCGSEVLSGWLRQIRTAAVGHKFGHKFVGSPAMRVLLLTLALTSVVALAAFAFGYVAGPAGAAVPRLYDNCTNFNKKYPHGVGRVGARDKTKSRSAERVTTFKRSNAIYRTAMRYNPDLDRDNDRIACEKA
jgi:hypothetical protein